MMRAAFNHRQWSGDEYRRNINRRELTNDPMDQGPNLLSYYRHTFPPEDLERVDVNGINLFDFIQATLHKNPVDRSFIIKIETQMIYFIRESNDTALKFPKLSSYNRMIIHRVAAYFCLDHNIDNSASSVICTKTPHTRLPTTPFYRMIFHSNWSDKSYRPPLLDEDELFLKDFGPPPDVLRRAASMDAPQPIVQSPKTGGSGRQRRHANSLTTMPLLMRQEKPAEMCYNPVVGQQIDLASNGTSAESDETDSRLQQRSVPSFNGPNYVPVTYNNFSASIPYSYVMVDNNTVVPRTDITALIQHFGAMNVQPTHPEYDGASPTAGVQPQQQSQGYFYHGAFYPKNVYVQYPYHEQQQVYTEAEHQPQPQSENDQDVQNNQAYGPPVTTSGMPEVTSVSSVMASIRANNTSVPVQTSTVSTYVPANTMYASVQPYPPQYIGDPNTTQSSYVPVNYVSNVDPGMYMQSVPYYVVSQAPATYIAEPPHSV